TVVAASRAGPDGEAAPMQPHHDRPASVVEAWGENVEYQAVLALRGRRSKRLDQGVQPDPGLLRARIAVLQGRTHSVPWERSRRRPEAARPGHRPAVRNA